MDIARSRPNRRLRAALRLAVGLAVVASIAVAVAFGARAKPRPDAVRRSAIWTGRVEKSPFVVRVKGAGALVPEAVRWLTAESSGRVEQVLTTPGATVDADTPVVRIENLDLRLQAIAVEREAETARSELLGLERSVREDEIARESEAASLRAATVEAERLADVYTRAAGSFVSGLDTKNASERAADLRLRTALAERKLGVVRAAAPAQVAALRAQIERRLEVTRVRRELVANLTVRACAAGVVQDVLVELGQWVVPGTNVAKVIVSNRLKAELRIPEEQAGGLAPGQLATIDTRAGTISGHVRRVAASAKHGTVVVEVALDGELPKGVRADQSVDGYVEIERTADTLHVPRPVAAQPNASAMLFRIDPATGLATRTLVRTGRASIDTLEVVSELRAGDEVILSDMSRYAGAESVRLEL